MSEKIIKLSYAKDNPFSMIKEDILTDIMKVNTSLKEVYQNNCVVVIISPYDYNGEILPKPEIHIYENFLEANPLLNQEQKKKENTVSVLHYDLKKDKFLFVLLKTNENYNYKRFSKRRVEKMFDKYDLEQKIKFLYNQEETKIVLH